MPPVSKKRRLNQASKTRSHNKKCPLLNVLDYDSQYPICDRICSFLPIGDLISLTRTCRQLSSLYQNLLPAQWNIDHRLLRFVSDPKALRSFMGKHNVLISGSFAIQFFERVTWEESDLDLYAEAGTSTEALEKYLCKNEGYRIIRQTGGLDYWPIDDWIEVRTSSIRIARPSIPCTDRELDTNIHEEEGRLHRIPDSDCDHSVCADIYHREGFLLDPRG